MAKELCAVFYCTSFPTHFPPITRPQLTATDLNDDGATVSYLPAWMIDPSVCRQSYRYHDIRSFPPLAVAWQTSTWGGPTRDTRDRWGGGGVPSLFYISLSCFFLCARSIVSPAAAAAPPPHYTSHSLPAAHAAPNRGVSSLLSV